MLCLSTSFRSKTAPSGEALFAEMERQNIDGVELEYRISRPKFLEMRDLLKRSRLQVVSIHNFFPIPPELPKSIGSGDLFSLGDLAEEKRQEAVRLTRRTIAHANEMEARAVVLHCGKVEMESAARKLRQQFQESATGREAALNALSQKQEIRQCLAPPHLDRLLKSLDALIRDAERENVVLGIENRFHYHQLPGIEEITVILSEFDGAPVGYWHDTGHAHAQEKMGIVPENAYLDRFSDRLVGAHLHDVQGLQDHLPPGTGEIDWKNLLSHLKPDTLRVMELKPGTETEAVRNGIAFLRESGF